MEELSTGTVTFLFTDIEGSTRLLERLGPERYGRLQDEHAAIIRRAIDRDSGVEIRTEGDAFFAVFETPAGALRAAVSAQRELAAHPWPTDAAIRVRMGLHTGEGLRGGDDYVGMDVHRAARVAAAAHGGQSRDGRHDSAVRLAGAAEAITESVGGGPPFFVMELLGDPIVAARAAIGEKAANRGLDEGRAMSVDEALAYVRGGRAP